MTNPFPIDLAHELDGLYVRLGTAIGHVAAARTRGDYEGTKAAEKNRDDIFEQICKKVNVAERVNGGVK